MKKIIAIALLMGLHYLSFSQIKRETQKSTNATSATISTEEKQENKYETLQKLGLSDTQKQQIKELRLSFKEKKDKIDIDSSLTDEMRNEKLKELKKEQARKMKSILTREQKIKLRKMMMEKKKQKNTGNDEKID